jgi:hypothetical protein
MKLPNNTFKTKIIANTTSEYAVKLAALSWNMKVYILSLMCRSTNIPVRLCRQNVNNKKNTQVYNDKGRQKFAVTLASKNLIYKSSWNEISGVYPS